MIKYLQVHSSDYNIFTHMHCSSKMWSNFELKFSLLNQGQLKQKFLVLYYILAASTAQMYVAMYFLLVSNLCEEWSSVAIIKCGCIAGHILRDILRVCSLFLMQDTIISTRYLNGSGIYFIHSVVLSSIYLPVYEPSFNYR